MEDHFVDWKYQVLYLYHRRLLISCALKVKGAQELGAVGVLIYSDLRDDGTVIQENGYVPWAISLYFALYSLKRSPCLYSYPHGPARSP